MKRCRFGAVLLLLLLAATLVTARAGREGPLAVSRLTGQIRQAADQGDWEKTAALTEKAGAAWEQTWKLQRLLHHQEKLMQVRILLTKLRTCGKNPPAVELLTEELQVRLQALGGRERPRFPG